MAKNQGHHLKVLRESGKMNNLENMKIKSVGIIRFATMNYIIKI